MNFNVIIKSYGDTNDRWRGRVDNDFSKKNISCITSTYRTQVARLTEHEKRSRELIGTSRTRHRSCRIQSQIKGNMQDAAAFYSEDF